MQTPLAARKNKTNTMPRFRPLRELGEQSCCAIVLHTPASNCGIDCTKGHRHTPDYNVGHFLKQLQVQFFDVQKRQYPIVMFHEDLLATQKRILRSKTLSPVMFFKLNLNPMALPMHLRPKFAAIVNATKEVHRNGDLFRTEKVGATFRGFQQRMLSRFYAGEMLMEHKSLRGYKYILRFDATDVRISAPFSYDPFERAQMLKSIYSYHTTTVEPETTIINPILSGWLENMEFSGKLIKPFVNKESDSFVYNGRAYSRSVELFKLSSFKTPTYKSMFEATDKAGAFLLSETFDKSLTDGQFLGIAIPFVASSSPQAVTELSDFPIQYHVDLDESYM